MTGRTNSVNTSGCHTSSQTPVSKTPDPPHLLRELGPTHASPLLQHHYFRVLETGAQVNRIDLPYKETRSKPTDCGSSTKNHCAGVALEQTVYSVQASDSIFVPGHLSSSAAGLSSLGRLNRYVLCCTCISIRLHLILVRGRRGQPQGSY